MTNKFYISRLVGLLLSLMLVLTACGGNDEPTGEPKPTATPLPVFEYVEPTIPPVFEQIGESTEEATSDDTVTLDPKLVERGLGRYEALECGTCHGVNGEGTDDGSALTVFSMSEEPFVTFMRSGGEIGSSHQYSTDRLSKNGAANLYQYLVSLTQGE